MYNNFAPKVITKPLPNLLSVEWTDGFKATVTLEKFRDECPCALCQHERENKGKDTMMLLSTFVAGKYELKALDKVGNYAVRAVWGDSHETGLYTWEVLRAIFEQNALTEDEIEKFKTKFNKVQ